MKRWQMVGLFAAAVVLAVLASSWVRDRYDDLVFLHKARVQSEANEAFQAELKRRQEAARAQQATTPALPKPPDPPANGAGK